MEFLAGMPESVTLSSVHRGSVASTGSITVEGGLAGTILIDGELNGILSAGELLGGVTINGCGPSTGGIEMEGDFDASSTLTISGDYAGNIIANSDGVGGGGIFGDVTIQGHFSVGANICGSNIPTSGSLPSNINIAHWECGAKRCGTSYPSVCDTQIAVQAAGSRYLKIIRRMTRSTPSRSRAIAGTVR